jgi:hypothetical protein
MAGEIGFNPRPRKELPVGPPSIIPDDSLINTLSGNSQEALSPIHPRNELWNFRRLSVNEQKKGK